MYNKRRIEEIIDKTLEVASVEVNKFAHNEDAPNMELKYDIWCSSEEVSNEVADSLNSLFNTFIANEVGYDETEEKYLVCVFLTWSVKESVSACNREDEIVRYYLSRNSGMGVEGSYEKDLKVLSDTEYTWGCI